MKLVCLSYQLSHFIPIMNFIMNKKIDNCIFFGEGTMYSLVTKLGYKYICCKSKDYLNILEYRKNFQYCKISKAYKELHDEVSWIIQEYNISEMICDISRYMFYAPAGYQNRIKVTVFWTYNGPTHLNFYAYPQTCFPEKESRLGCLGAWLKQFYCGEVKSKKIFFYFIYPYSFLFHPKFFLKLKYSIDGFFVDTNKIICGPHELTNYFDKKTEFDDKRITFYLNGNKRANYIFLKNDKKKIYVTLGTNNIRYDAGVEIVNHIITCLGEQEDICLIVNTGNVEITKFINNYKNVFYVKNINQVKIVRNVDYVIFHGGFGTLKECYYYNKRMIVIPFLYDQYANAKLVQNRNLGIALNIDEAKKINYCKLLNL